MGQEGSGHGLQRGTGWMHGAQADIAVQSLSKAADCLQSPTHPFLKVSPKDEKREQPVSTKPSRAQPVLCLLRRGQHLAPLAASA